MSGWDTFMISPVELDPDSYADMTCDFVPDQQFHFVPDSYADMTRDFVQTHRNGNAGRTGQQLAEMIEALPDFPKAS
jgi:hypothetical protein